MKFPESFQSNNENVQLWMKETIDLLRSSFHIENLSNNELFIIKKITEDVLDRFDPKLKTDDQYVIDKEIATRFLTEAYGLYTYWIEKQTETKEDMEGFREYIRRIRERSHLI